MFHAIISLKSYIFKLWIVKQASRLSREEESRVFTVIIYIINIILDCCACVPPFNRELQSRPLLFVRKQGARLLNFAAYICMIASTGRTSQWGAIKKAGKKRKKAKERKGDLREKREKFYTRKYEQREGRELQGTLPHVGIKMGAFSIEKVPFYI